MHRDPTEFRARFKAYREGKKPYNAGRPVAIQEVDKSDADFAKRLRSNWRQEIWDWEGSGKSATHKMSSSDNIVYPNVQTTEGGGLIDFTNPIWKGVVDPRQRAIQHGDFVPMKTESDAIWFGPNYKKYYPGFKNGKLPRYGDGTDGISNNIPEDYIPLVSNTYQPIVDEAKQKMIKFAIDDYIYRAQKQHPEVTKQQAQEIYNNTPYIGSDSRKGTTVGQYWHGDDDGYGRRVMVYPKGMRSDDPEFNLQDRINSTVLHESNHLFRDVLLGGKYTDKERQYLEAAYPGVPINEAAALNAQIREKLSNVYGNGAVGDKLDAMLEKIRQNKNMQNEMMFHLNNLNEYGHADKINGQWDSKTIDAMTNALINVASIQSKPSRGLIRAKNGKLPGCAGGKDPNEDVADFLRQHEGYSDKVYLDGNGIPTIGYGFTDPKFVSKGTISRSTADAELKRQIKSRQNVLRDILGADKWDSLTDDSRKALTSYHFNYPAGFKDNTKFMKAWRAGNYAEAIRQVDAGMNDPKNPGLRTRRLAEQALLKADPFLVGRHEVPIQPIIAQPVSTAVRPVIAAEQTIPAYDPTISSYVSGKPMVKLMPPVRQPNLIEMVEDSQWEPQFGSYKNGKSPIHIKPANRGKFTALKKRTGHSASWFKENGTPAQKKMAVFALNAKKWHHADGKLPEYGNGTDALLQLAKGGVSIIPGAGTLIDGWDFYNDPSLENLGYLALSGIGDAAIFTGIGAPFGFSLKAIKSAAKLNKTRKTLNAVMSANKAGNAIQLYDAKKAYDASKAASRALAAETGNLVDTAKSTYEAYTK